MTPAAFCCMAAKHGMVQSRIKVEEALGLLIGQLGIGRLYNANDDEGRAANDKWQANTHDVDGVLVVCKHALEGWLVLHTSVK